MKRAAFLLLLTIGWLRAATLSGYVTDAETGETIIGVNILVARTGMGSTTDQNGFFVIRNVPPGEVELVFTHIAHERRTLAVSVADDDLFLDIVSLAPAVLRTDAIVVTGKRGNLIEQDMDIASFEVSPAVLREVPQFNKDVFRLITYSPSITISDPLSPLYFVRGSDPGENLIQLDGMTIYNPQHLLSSQAIFNPYAIKEIELLVGGFDAEHGGRNSSILYITSREGHKEEVRGEFRPSTSGLVGAVEFPAPGGGTAMVSGRMLSSMVSRIMMGMPNVMADFNGAYQTTVGRTRLRFSTLLARDLVDYDFARLGIYFDSPIFRDYSTGFLTDATNTAAGLRTRSVLTPNLVLATQVYYSGFRVDNKNFLHFSFTDEESGTLVVLDYETRVRNHISDYTAKADLALFTNWRQTLKVGGEQNWYRFFNRAGVLSSQALTAIVQSDLQAVFMQDKIDLGPVLLKAGLRWSRLAPGGQWRSEPRLALTIKGKHLTFKAAGGRYHQYLATMNTQDFEISQFLDYYYPLTGLEPLTSIQYVAGIEGKITDRVNFSATLYYKDLRTLYRFDYLNTLASILSYQAALERGRGEAYGLELLVRGEVGHLSGWLSYSLSRATRSYPSIMEGREFLYDADMTHALKGVVLYSLTADVTASVTAQLSSGYPKTWDLGYANHFTYDPIEDQVGIYPVPLTPVKNNVRYPPRILLDLGWKKKLRTGFGYRLAEYIGSDQAYFTMSIQNILFLRRNPIFYFRFPGMEPYAYDYQLFPMITAGYSIKF